MRKSDLELRDYALRITLYAALESCMRLRTWQQIVV